MYGRWFILFFPALWYREEYEYRVLLVIYMLILIQHSRIKVGYSPPEKKTLWDSNPRFQTDIYYAVLKDGSLIVDQYTVYGMTLWSGDEKY